MNAQWGAPYRSPSARWTGWLLVIGLIAGGAAMLGPHAAAQAAGDADVGHDVYTANCAMRRGADATGMMGMHPALRGAVHA